MTMPKTPVNASCNRGFTLIELMIAVAVVSILATIAVTAYTSQVQKSRRTDARSALLDIAGREEKLFSTANAYSALPSDLGYGAVGVPWPITVGSGYYQVYVCISTTAVGTTATSTPCVAASTATAGTSYVVAALAYASTQLADTSCQYFAVDNTGTQFATSSNTGSGTDTTSTCWQ